MKLQILALLSVLMVSAAAEAKKCRAWLYDRSGSQIGQYTNSDGCEEARAECLSEGAYRAPYGYCQDERGTVVYVNSHDGDGDGYCEVALYVNGKFITNFENYRCRQARLSCENHARDHYYFEWSRNNYYCQRY